MGANLVPKIYHRAIQWSIRRPAQALQTNKPACARNDNRIHSRAKVQMIPWLIRLFHSNQVWEEIKHKITYIAFYVYRKTPEDWFSFSATLADSWGTYLENSLPTVSEWQHIVWNTNEQPKQMIAPRKKAPKTSFSCNCTSIEGRVKKYVASPMNATHPRRCVHILPAEHVDFRICRRKGLKRDTNWLIELTFLYL